MSEIKQLNISDVIKTKEELISIVNEEIKCLEKNDFLSLSCIVKNEKKKLDVLNLQKRILFLDKSAWDRVTANEKESFIKVCNDLRTALDHKKNIMDKVIYVQRTMTKMIAKAVKEVSNVPLYSNIKEKKSDKRKTIPIIMDKKI